MKKAIVIGASSGIGREVAILLRQHGWTVGVAARRLDRLADFDVAAQIDITAEDAPERLAALIERLGGMDLYFHADIELQTVNTNGMGFVRMVGAAWRYMADHGGGHIAVISSIAGTKGLGPAPSYSATKALQNTYIQALEQLSNSRHLGIRFTDLRPGFVDTDLLSGTHRYPLLMDKQDVARSIVRAVEHRRHIQVIDLRWRLVTALWRRIPRWLWRKFPL